MKPVLFKTLGELEKGCGIEFSQGPKGQVALSGTSGPPGCLGLGQHVQRPRGREHLLDPVSLGFMLSGELWGYVGGRAGESG